MKIFTRFFNPKKLEQKLEQAKDVKFSLFIDDVPKSQEDLSEINIMVLVEPNEYFGYHDWVVQNKHLFQIILTWNDKLLNNLDNTVLFPFGSSWMKPDQYEKHHDKKFELSHLCGVLNKTYGQNMRHEILARKDEFKKPTNFYETIGNRHNLEDARFGKETVFGNSMFGVAIENFSHRNWFSEKILDCFLMKTIPCYWGCSNIKDFFNKDGIIPFQDIDDLIYIYNNHNLEEMYKNLEEKGVIEENYQKAIKYVNYEQNVVDYVIELFKHNKLI
jgi:hypothetical protein